MHRFVKQIFFSFSSSHPRRALPSVFPIWSFLQKPKTNHGWASMILSSISLSLSLLNHQLSSLKITLFPLRSHRSKQSKASMVNLNQHHHKTPYPKPTHWKITLFPIWFSFPQNPKPTLRSISQRALDDVWILVWIGVGVFLFSLSRGLCGDAVVWVSGDSWVLVWINIEGFGFSLSWCLWRCRGVG